MDMIPKTRSRSSSPTSVNDTTNSPNYAPSSHLAHSDSREQSPVPVYTDKVSELDHHMTQEEPKLPPVQIYDTQSLSIGTPSDMAQVPELETDSWESEDEDDTLVEPLSDEITISSEPLSLVTDDLVEEPFLKVRDCGWVPPNDDDIVDWGCDDDDY